MATGALPVLTLIFRAIRVRLGLVVADVEVTYFCAAFVPCEFAYLEFVHWEFIH